MILRSHEAKRKSCCSVKEEQKLKNKITITKKSVQTFHKLNFGGFFWFFFKSHVGKGGIAKKEKKKITYTELKQEKNK